MEIKKENLLAAYNGASDEQKQLLENLFGKETFKPKNIMDRIKTVPDACEALGTEHPFVQEYLAVVNNCTAPRADLVAYLKLRIITAALNEGWTPQFTKGEQRWYCWYDLITKEQYDKLDEEDKARVVGRGGVGAGADCGLVCAGASYVSSVSGANSGSRLAFKSEALAEYAAKQFIEIYADFCFKADGKAE